MEKKAVSTLSGVFAFASRSRRKMAVSVVLAVLGVLFGMLPYFAVAAIIERLYSNTATIGSIILWALAALAGETLKMLMSTVSTQKSHQAAYMILESIRCQIADKMLRVPMGVLQASPTGKWKSLIVDVVEKLEKALAHMLPEITANLTTPLFIFILLLVFDWRMALASLITIPVAALSYWGMMRGYQAKSQQYLQAGAAMDSALVEYVHGIKVIKAFNQSATSFGRYSNAVNHYHDTTLKWWNSTQGYSALGFTFIPAALAGTLPVGAWLFSQGSLSFAMYITCMALSVGIAGPLMQAAKFMDDAATIDACMRQVTNFLDTPELPRPALPAKLDGSGFVFQDVCFGYGEQDVLHDISFAPVSGGVTAIVGPSGSGKSTLAKLMAGFWDVDSGAVFYGGCNIKDIPAQQLMENISFVAQDNFLFDISIKENIRMGNPAATDEQVCAAAKAACCHGFIQLLENGYDTKPGEAGDRLSGGERQRITLARAILKDAQVVILDEATAYADPENEALIQAAIHTLVKGKTLIVVAHRLSSIQHANRIVVMDKGQIAAQGEHQTLLDTCPIYRKLWREHLFANELDKKGV